MPNENDKEKQDKLIQDQIDALLLKYPDGNIPLKEVEPLLDELTKKQTQKIILDSADLQTKVQDLMVSIQNSPEYKSKIARGEIQAGRSKLFDQVQLGVATLGRMMDLGISVDQKREGRRALKRLRMPLPPGITAPNQLLSQQLNSSLRNINDVSPELGAARLNILDTYLADLSNARTASGGQAGLFGSLAQSAANRRLRGGLQLGALSSNIRSRNQGRLDRLLGMRMSEDQTRFNQLEGLYKTGLGQYNVDAQSAGALRAAGALNERNSLQGLLKLVPYGVTESILPMPSYSPFGPEFDTYKDQVQQGLRQSYSNNTTPYGSTWY